LQLDTLLLKSTELRTWALNGIIGEMQLDTLLLKSTALRTSTLNGIIII
jgi:hypothetical protein